MSMIFNMLPVPTETLSFLQQNPSSITEFLYPGSNQSPAGPGFFKRLFGAKPKDEPNTATNPIAELKRGEEISLDKSWHGLHYLFTGTTWEGEPPASFLLNWGSEIGDVDVGYGPARGFTAQETSTISHYLSSITIETLTQRYNPQRMMELEIYPTIWDRDGELDYLLEYFPILSNFVNESRAKGMGFVVYLN